MAEKFKSFYIDHVPHQQNAHADTLVSLAASLALPAERQRKYSFTVITRTVQSSSLKTIRHHLQVKEVLKISIDQELRDWLFLFIDFVLYSILPDDPKEVAATKRKAPRFYYNVITQTLYCRSYDGIQLCCLSHKEAQEASGKLTTACAKLTNSDPNLGTDSEDLVTIGQIWFLMMSPTLSSVAPVRFMVTSSIKHQVISIQRLLLSHLRRGGMDVIRPITPQTSKRHWFILVITDYFSKWVEVIPLKEVKMSDVIKFIKHHVLYRFGLP